MSCWRELCTDFDRGEECHLSMTLVTGHPQRCWYCNSSQVTNNIRQTTYQDSKGKNTMNKWRKGRQECVNSKGMNYESCGPLLAGLRVSSTSVAYVDRRWRHGRDRSFGKLFLTEQGVAFCNSLYEHPFCNLILTNLPLKWNVPHFHKSRLVLLVCQKNVLWGLFFDFQTLSLRVLTGSAFPWWTLR